MCASLKYNAKTWTTDFIGILVKVNLYIFCQHVKISDCENCILIQMHVEYILFTMKAEFRPEGTIFK